MIATSINIISTSIVLTWSFYFKHADWSIVLLGCVHLLSLFLFLRAITLNIKNLQPWPQDAWSWYCHQQPEVQEWIEVVFLGWHLLYMQVGCLNITLLITFLVFAQFLVPSPRKWHNISAAFCHTGLSLYRSKGMDWMYSEVLWILKSTWKMVPFSIISFKKKKGYLWFEYLTSLSVHTRKGFKESKFKDHDFTKKTL